MTRLKSTSLTFTHDKSIKTRYWPNFIEPTVTYGQLKIEKCTLNMF